ncbi:MAG: tetratricopeptide repeat protein [Pirellulales bacterium]|nr:tetratricopeptide repeat protein [Pirellulales bacterium]
MSRFRNGSFRIGKRCDAPQEFFAGFRLFWVGLLLLTAGCGGINASGRNAEGVRLFQQARFNEAMREFQEASYADPNNADAYYNMASAFHHLGKTTHCDADLQKAETYYNMCLDRDENHVDCHRGLAVLLAEQGRKAEAFRLLEGWVAQQPASGDAKVELARLCEEFGDRKTAEERLVEALAAQPDNPRALAALGKIREESGDYAQALVNYQRSLNYDNRQPQLASRISSLQTTLGITPASTIAPTPPSISNGTLMAAPSTTPRRY